jgi:hypothetical protein
MNNNSTSLVRVSRETRGQVYGLSSGDPITCFLRIALVGFVALAHLSARLAVSGGHAWQAHSVLRFLTPWR